jgi:hypothetical protein
MLSKWEETSGKMMESQSRFFRAAVGGSPTLSPAGETLGEVP